MLVNENFTLNTKNDSPKNHSSDTTTKKKCNKCGIHKLFNEFWKRNDRISGYVSSCKVCLKKQKNIYRKTHRDKIKEYEKKYRENNKDSLKFKEKKYRENNKYKIAKRKREYHKNNVNSRISSNIRSRIYKYLKTDKPDSPIKALGCSINELKQHLELKFSDGMTWNNYGKDGWHIDHIKPLSLFDLTDRQQFIEACHYTNLQPLWAKDNILKSNNYGM